MNTLDIGGTRLFLKQQPVCISQPARHHSIHLNMRISLRKSVNACSITCQRSVAPRHLRRPLMTTSAPAVAEAGASVLDAPSEHEGSVLDAVADTDMW